VDKKNFDKRSFGVREDDGVREIDVLGEKTAIYYQLDPKSPPASDLDIQLNYRAALADMGAEILLEEPSRTVARLNEGGRVAWVDISSQTVRVDVAAIEEKALQLTVAAPKAEEMKAALAKSGRMVLNIEFDFAKADIRPSSMPVVQQVAALMKAEPGLNVAIEGHTEDVGGRELNMRLSDARARAVVAAVAAQGVDAARMSPAGFGPDKPVASNADSEGRARNRRVELVKP
jgi:outer membrane protein OmpA-like peptidoglycan-associated protein